MAGSGWLAEAGEGAPVCPGVYAEVPQGGRAGRRGRGKGGPLSASPSRASWIPAAGAATTGH